MATEEEKKKLMLYDSSYLDRLQKSQAALDSHLSARPGDYQSKYQEQINKAMESIANRKPFQYDVNGDALYQQYKDRYTQMGKQAMQNTMGQAAALTGGYGNTYAQQVGQQGQGQRGNLGESNQQGGRCFRTAAGICGQGYLVRHLGGGKAENRRHEPGDQG